MAYQPFDCRAALVTAHVLLLRWRQKEKQLVSTLTGSDRSLYTETGILCQEIEKALYPEDSGEPRQADSP